ncbi:TPA: hypothetical protein ACH3X3_003028 [Trebouxia sp. C0006]
MLRGAFTSAATRVAGGAAVAAAAAPEVSHARAVQPRSVLAPRSKDEETGHFNKGLESMHVPDGEWMMANVRDGNVFVEPADVQDALSEMLGLSYRAKPVHARNAQGAEIVSEDDDVSSCTSSGASANDHIERADLLPIRQCGSLLTTLLNNPGVQQSVHQALQEDPNFARFIESQGPSHLLAAPPSDVVIEDVTDAPDAPEQDYASRSNPFQAALGKLGDGLVKLGEDVISAGGHLGNMFVGLGNKMRGTILGAHAQTKKAVQEPGNHKDFWMNTLGVLAIAVLSILFAKGKLRVRTA